MKKFFTALIISIALANAALATPVTNIDQAVELVQQSVVKNQLSSLRLECIMFVEAQTEFNAPDYQIDVRENHNAQCRGDPDTAPRLFSYLVNKATGRLQTDAIWREDNDQFSGVFYPIDPIAKVQKSGEELTYFIRGSGKRID
ncbi:hypothetical protein L5B71_03800 [Avibacterium sp. 21-586]|uniref:hypothetical protein n=1 Tax=Avibacterium sp. 21-586 TaxID=2911534 RepID=UPI002244FE74|nr:hypothetical protein [Avibacterium sp. 21-586]MCW9710014.1 hypothetical protein [Avibacterium sp. 21-586]